MMVVRGRASAAAGWANVGRAMTEANGTHDTSAAKLSRLRTIVERMGSLVLAFSAGCDSTLLLKVAAEALSPEHLLAVVARSPIFPAAETADAERLAREMGVSLVVVDSKELDEPAFVANQPGRCHLCKSRFFERLRDVADERGIAWLADGTNADDLAEGRPSLEALEERGVRHPLAEAGLTKPEIRELSRSLGLETWDKPGRPCLASRISFGVEVTEDRLARVAAAEALLVELGFVEPVVRYHAEEMARVKVSRDQLTRGVEPETMDRAVAGLKGLGFELVVIDLGAAT